MANENAGTFQKWHGDFVPKALGWNKSEDVPNHTASDEFASATRQAWSNYTQTFIPIENNLIKYATDPNTVSNAVSSAGVGVDQAFQAQQGATQRHLQGLGVQLSPDEQAAQTRASGLEQSLAKAQTMNTARDLTVQRQQGILGNPAPQGVGP